MKILSSIALFCLIALGTVKAEPKAQVILMGGSSVRGTYLPEEFTEHATLQRALEAHYGAGSAEVYNWADNGEFIARFLFTGKYEKFRVPAKGADIFIIRFGTNDSKRMPPEEYGQHLEKLLDLLHEDFPDAKFILGDGIYLDYPEHYLTDRNKKLLPVWKQTRAVAKKRDLAFTPLYEASKAETLKGNWDLRIRSQRNKVITLDASKDAENAGDVAWFTDIHPNPAGVQVAVDTEMEVIKKMFPNKLPSGGRKTERPERSGQDYMSYLNFSEERLVIPTRENPDKLQKATK